VDESTKGVLRDMAELMSETLNLVERVLMFDGTPQQKVEILEALATAQKGSRMAFGNLG
jgi:hypothetical protein